MHNMLVGIMRKVPAASHSDYGFAGKEGTQASTLIGADLLLAYWSTGSPKAKPFHWTARQGLPPSAMQSLVC
jgi:hypothetical protein